MIGEIGKLSFAEYCMLIMIILASASASFVLLLFLSTYPGIDHWVKLTLVILVCSRMIKALESLRSR